MNVFEKRIVNLISSHFNEVCTVTKNNGKRGKLISGLITTSLNDFVQISNKNVSSTINQQQIKQLMSLKVCNFRGFSTIENFDLSNKYTFVYGRNGTGKSSFCDALEYSFLGDIEECKIKRIKMYEYIKNIYTNKGEKPELKVTTLQGAVAKLIPNKSKYFFGFIERNRIEKFARINADTPQFQQQRLSSLFGLDDWNEFVHNFNNNIDNYLIDNNVAANNLADKQSAYKNAQTFLENFDQQIDTINLKTKKILQRYKKINNSEEFITYLDGQDQEHPGLIKKLSAIITKFSNIKPQNLEQLTSLKELISNYKQQSFSLVQKIKNLAEYKGNMSLKQLYSEIITAKAEFDSVCPACLSPIYDSAGNLRLTVDPYNNANTELKKLSEGIALETDINKAKKKLAKTMNEIKRSLGLLTTQFSKIKYQTVYNTAELETRIDLLIDKQVFTEHNFFDDLYYQLQEIEINLIKYNERLQNRAKRLSSLTNIIDSVKKDRDEIIGLKNQFGSLQATKKSSIEKMDQIQISINAIKHKFNEETSYNEIFEEYRKAYVQFRDHLIEYTDSLPISLIQFLEDKTLEIYNFINKNDLLPEKLSYISLPKRPSEGINIFLNNSPEKAINALMFLSEGHLRCLGLSILLAKNLREGLPFIVFDDVVNAIDDEHRQAIAELILENESFLDKQWIVTTHAEEFIKRLDNMVSHQKIENDVKRIDFRRKIQADKINIALDDDRNYISRARNYFKEDKFRDALAECRRGIESLITAIWKVYLKWYKEPIQVNLYSRTSPLESKSLFDNLLSCWKKNQSKDHKVEFDNLIKLMNSVCEFGNRNPILWTYMNKGTHEEEREEDFIMEVIDELIVFDNLELSH